MKVSIFGTGLIGSQVIKDLAAAGHEATGHSRSTGVDLTVMSCTCPPPRSSPSAPPRSPLLSPTSPPAPRCAAPATSLAGPDVFSLDELGRITLAATGDHRHVVTDPTAGLFALVRGDVLTAPEGAHLAATQFRDWLRSH
jgi:uncharacterized protein YbjT (DUF2867 family)